MNIEPNLPKGIAFLLLSVFTGVTTISILNKFADQHPPFLTAYFWEAFIALCGLGVVTISRTLQKQSFPVVRWQEYKYIFWSSSPTLLGTGCLVVALSIGDLSIAGAVMTGAGVFVSTVLAWIMHKERLKPLQWFLIFMIVACLVGLKLVS